MTVTVHSHGIHYRWLQDVPEVLLDELRRAHDLREDLVTMELEHEETKKQIWSAYPQVAVAEAALAAAEAEAVEAAAAVKAERVQVRSKRVSSLAAARLRDARAAAKAARVARREAIGHAREDAKPALAAAAGALRAAQKALYGAYCTGGDMYWATFNDVLDHHRTAVKRIGAKRAQGQPATLRRHRWDGSGTVAVQLQRATGAPPRTPATIADGDAGKWRNVLHVPGWVRPDEWEGMSRAEQRKAGRVTLRMRCGPGHIEVPVQVSRMLPADADIVMARLTLTRVGSQMRGTVTVTAKVPDPLPVTDGPSVALHLGWHRDPDIGGVTVATWRASGPLDIPADLVHVMPADPGRASGRVVVPADLLGRLTGVDQMDSARDLAFDAAREQLAVWLDVHGPLPHPRFEDRTLSRADLARWRNPSRLAVLVLAWRDDPPEGMGDLLPELESWRAADKRAWDAGAFSRRKSSRCRDDLYRQVAAVIAWQAGALVVDTTGVAALARRDPDDETPNEVAARVARQRSVAAPGTLREACVAAAERDGVTVHKVDAAGLSRVHAACGHDNGPDKDYGSRRVVCDGCGRTYDTERSAVALMLQRAAPAA